MAQEVIVILGNQLVPNHPALKAYPDSPVVMIEADNICRKHRYHKHKLAFVLASMRSYRDELRDRGRDVTYISYKPKSSFKYELGTLFEKMKPSKLVYMRPSDKGPDRCLSRLARDYDLPVDILRSTQFIGTIGLFSEWLDRQKSTAPRMESFYRWQRQQTGILMNGKEPEGGTWNLDHDNRKPLPKNHPSLPELPSVTLDKNLKDVTKIINQHFADNPGTMDTFWLPTTRSEALEWLHNFIKHRLSNFGPYEDAMKAGEPFLYHSVLSPLINIGLLAPDECVNAAVNAYKSGTAPLNSVEGFVRQIIGWRQFMYGLYYERESAFRKNHFKFKKQLEDWWYDERAFEQDLPEPIIDTLKRLHTYGYNHHIERLMILGNWFLLSGYDPKSVYDWFMSMYVDAYEWVMVPNVLGMSQYADGGMLATKPYVSGGNYLQKMGNWWPSAQAAKDSAYTTKYWQFLYDNKDTFANNQRMSLVVAQAKKRFES